MTFYETPGNQSQDRNSKKLEFMDSSIHGTSYFSYCWCILVIFQTRCLLLSSFAVLAQIEISPPFANLETSIQNGCYHPFTLQENILLPNTMGNIHVTCTPLSMLFATSMGLFNSGIKRQVLGPSHVQTPMPCCGKLCLAVQLDVQNCTFPKNESVRLMA